ncbi:MAG: GxxExxY protein [Bacteroidia bacterium]
MYYHTSSMQIFVVYDDIILEVKAVTGIVDVHIAQTLNYVRLINGYVGIIANFNSKSLEHRRIVR